MSRSCIVLGCGARGLHIAQILHRELGRPVSAVVENNPAAHEVVQYRLKDFGMSETRLFSSFKDALTAVPATEAGSVFVMTPNWRHREDAAAALQAGRHVFLEKPMAASVEDIRRIVEMAENTDKTVQLGFVLRYAPFYRKIKQIIDSGELGRLVVIQMSERLSLLHGASYQRNWRRLKKQSGGFINEKCSHDLDLICWFKENQGKPVNVFSVGGKHFYPEEKSNARLCRDCNKERCPWREGKSKCWNQINGKVPAYAMDAPGDLCVFHSDSDVMDHQSVQLGFDDGTQAVFLAVRSSGRLGRDVMIFGTDGYLEGELEQGKLLVMNYWKDQELRDESIPASNMHGGGDIEIVKEFLECIDEGIRPLATVRDGARASMLAFAADKSTEERRLVNLAEFRF